MGDGLGLGALWLAALGGSARAVGRERVWTFRLRETAGLRRFGYPVHALLPAEAPGPGYRLERGGKPVAAQFRPVSGPDGRPAVALDFNASPGPLETEVYNVRSGEIEPGPEPARGMTVEQAGGVFRVANGSVLAYEVPDHLGGFLRSVRNTRAEFVNEGSTGLTVRDRNGKDVPLGGPGEGGRGPEYRGTVTRKGPFAVGLRFEGKRVLGDTLVRSVAVEMTFPNSKSWVEVRWTVDDPVGYVSGLGLTLDLKVEGEPTLVDLGASNMVYGYLRGAEAMALVAGEAPGVRPLGTAWTVEKGAPGSTSLFASATGPNAPPAEGWAHVMDKTRCAAVAVADFGRASRDEIRVGVSGRLEIRRQFAVNRLAPSEKPKALTFWIHYVPNPVQVGAVTSPQAMLAPLEVAWEPAGG
jgi:hypothetical protein